MGYDDYDRKRDEYRESEFRRVERRDWDHHLDDRRYREQAERERQARLHEAVGAGDTPRAIHEIVGPDAAIQYLKETSPSARSAPTPEELGRVQFESGRRHLEAGRFAEAERDFSRCLILGGVPAAVVHNARGLALRRSNDLQGALADFAIAAALRPDFGAAHFNHALCLRDLRRFDEAVQAAGEDICLKPTAETHELRAQCREELADYAGAAEDLAEALRLGPESKDLLMLRAYYLGRAELVDEARKTCDRVIALDPKMAAAWLRRGTLRGRAGDVRGAISDLSQAIRLEPDNRQAYYHRAAMRLREEDAAGALEDIERDMVHNPQDPNTAFLCAQCLRALERFREALGEFGRAAVLFEKRGDTDGARAAHEASQRILQE